MQMLLLYAVCLIVAVVSSQDDHSSSFEVLSTDHSSWFSGNKYFNFMISDVDAILGRTDWDGEVFTIRNSRFEGPLEVIMWRSANGGSVGDGHGRREPREHASRSDWQTGDVLSFVDEASINSVYTHAIGHEAFYYAFGAMCSADAINSWTNGLGDGPPEVKQFELYKVINTGALQAYIGYDGARSRILMSFRGSENTENWLDTNFDFGPEPYPNAPGVANANIHPGFYDAFKTLEQGGLGNAIKEMVAKYPGSDWLSTGHSLGGALCSVAALELKQSPVYSGLNIGNIDVITFGMPRVFSPSLVDVFDDVIRTSWRIVNRYDLVATVPTKFMGYQHFGTEIWYRWQRWWWNETPTGFKLCNGSGEDKACFGTDFWADRLPMIHHHNNYFEYPPYSMCKATRRRLADSRLIE